MRRCSKCTIEGPQCAQCYGKDREDRVEALEAENRRMRAERDTPELHDFVKAVVLEAQHQRARWGIEHDAGKLSTDWFWLVGYLAGKVLHALSVGDAEKAKHHTISTAATLANWHAALSGHSTVMRPGIEPPEDM